MNGLSYGEVRFRCPHCGEADVPSARDPHTGRFRPDVYFDEVVEEIFENASRGVRQPVVCSRCIRVFQCRMIRRPDNTLLLKPNEGDEGRLWEPRPIWAARQKEKT